MDDRLRDGIDTIRELGFGFARLQLEVGDAQKRSAQMAESVDKLSSELMQTLSQSRMISRSQEASANPSPAGTPARGQAMSYFAPTPATIEPTAMGGYVSENAAMLPQDGAAHVPMQQYSTQQPPAQGSQASMQGAQAMHAWMAATAMPQQPHPSLVPAQAAVPSSMPPPPPSPTPPPPPQAVPPPAYTMHAQYQQPVAPHPPPALAPAPPSASKPLFVAPGPAQPIGVAPEQPVHLPPPLPPQAPPVAARPAPSPAASQQPVARAPSPNVRRMLDIPIGEEMQPTRPAEALAKIDGALANWIAGMDSADGGSLELVKERQAAQREPGNQARMKDSLSLWTHENPDDAEDRLVEERQAAQREPANQAKMQGAIAQWVQDKSAEENPDAMHRRVDQWVEQGISTTDADDTSVGQETATEGYDDDDEEEDAGEEEEEENDDAADDDSESAAPKKKKKLVKKKKAASGKPPTRSSVPGVMSGVARKSATSLRSETSTAKLSSKRSSTSIGSISSVSTLGATLKKAASTTSSKSSAKRPASVTSGSSKAKAVKVPSKLKP